MMMALLTSIRWTTSSTIQRVRSTFCQLGNLEHILEKKIHHVMMAALTFDQVLISPLSLGTMGVIHVLSLIPPMDSQSYKLMLARLFIDLSVLAFGKYMTLLSVMHLQRQLWYIIQTNLTYLMMMILWMEIFDLAVTFTINRVTARTVRVNTCIRLTKEERHFMQYNWKMEAQ